ncbi:type II toxin-antitoxin system VapC family toxin [Nostoc ellipsosporum NOK]|nr:type II toxin-antitoxin system VapC family toxin [Nostoc ellipsosporum NOK]
MKYLLDANICILMLAGGSEILARRITDCDAGDLGVSVVVFAELALGSNRGRPPPPEALDGLIEQVELLPFDEAAARAYATLPFRRGSFDRLIAAHALALDLTLVTNNERDLSDIPELKIENWTL